MSTRFAASVGSDLAVIAIVALIAAIAGMHAPAIVDFIYSAADFG